VSPQRLGRLLRVALLLAIAFPLASALRSTERYAIPPRDHSLYPHHPGGAIVLADPLDPHDPVPRGADVVYAQRHDGVAYARFGRVYGLPGDRVEAVGGVLHVNGASTHLPGATMGEVPAGFVLVLAPNPTESDYPDSRRLGFVPRADLRALIRSSIRTEPPR
jgi:hypothetical protein